MMEKLLIRNGHVVSVDDSIGTVPNCDVLVIDGKIEAVGPALEVGDAEVIDASGTVVVPGFIDTHRHLWQTAIRGLLPSCSLWEYFGAVMVTAGPAFRAEDMYTGNLLGSFEALNAGVTTVVDWCHCTNTPDHADAAIRALEESGIRAVFAYGPPSGIEWLQDSRLGHPEDARRVRSQYFASDDQLMTFALALRGPAAVDPDLNRGDFELARELDARITIHSGMRIPGRRARDVEILDETGMLGADITYVHCNEIPDADLKKIADSGGTVSISPYVEMLMGHGHPPTGRLLKQGLRPTLSVDVTTSAPGEMFTQMRTALAHERIQAFPAQIDVPFEPTLEAMDVLRFATIDGAAACGLEDRIGSLTPGKQADLVLIRADQINTIPAVDPVAIVVTCADTSNVDTVIVGGNVVKRDGVLVGADLARLGAIGAEARDHVMGALATAGPPPSA
jgi:cytosine/adenosine deaminase-related metal-dependent hydrolase